MCKIIFSMSEGQAERFPDWESRELTIEKPGSVYLVYGFLQDEDATVLARFDGDYWIAERDRREYSDVGIVSDEASV